MSLLKISENKCRYDKGQVFPFLIAMLVAVIAVAMITVNLGQIGIFKTDVSNAADAGALAATSTLSGYLLGTGLKSDTMCGFMIVTVAALVVEILLAAGHFAAAAAALAAAIAADATCAIPPCIGCAVAIAMHALNVEELAEAWAYVIAAIATYAAYIIKMNADLLQAKWDGEMAWSNAKKAALQYAFQNAGIDEPRPTFNQFVWNVYHQDPTTLSPADIVSKNKIYALGDDLSNNIPVATIKKYTQSGFSRYMEGNWFWDDNAWKTIAPGNEAPQSLTAGYGWKVDEATGLITNSYDNGGSYNDTSKYDNYVEVTVAGRQDYPLDFYNPLSAGLNDLGSHLGGGFIGEVIGFILDAVASLLSGLLPGGLQMQDNDIVAYTDNNPITVTVKRYKRNNNLGLWNFRYGVVQATAKSHLYREGDQNITPVLWYDLWDLITSGFTNWDKKWFDTSRHLFESELTVAT